MPAPGTIDFSFRVDEDYAAVCVEGIAVLASPTNQLGGLLDRPPIPNQMLGSGGTPEPADLEERGSKVASQPYAKWFVKVKRAFDKIGAVLFNPEGGLVVITAWSVRETDVAWYGLLTVDDAQTTVTPTLTGASRFGQSVQEIAVTAGGDYESVPDVVVTDPEHKGGGVQAIAVMDGRVVDSIQLKKHGAGFPSAPTVTFEGGGGAGGATATASLYPWAPGQRFLIDDGVVVDGRWSYEICEITAIDPATGEWTIARGVLGTTPAAHADAKFYLLVAGRFNKVLTGEAAPQCWKFLWPNMCVAIAEGYLLGSPITTLNLFPADDGQGARPGLRTMSGAAYISIGVEGSVSTGQNTNRADAGQSWETIRTQIAKVRLPPSGADLVLLLCWIAPNHTDVGLLGTITIPDGELESYDFAADPPRNRQMPYRYAAEDPIWPPVRLTRCIDALDPDGNLLETMTFGDREVYFEPNGDIVGVVVEGGGAEDLRVTLET
jgi:hypothetical protein